MNVTAGTLEGLVTFVGPALAALLLLGVDPWVVVAVSSLAALGGLLAVAGINITIDPSKAVRRSRRRTPRCVDGWPDGAARQQRHGDTRRVLRGADLRSWHPRRAHRVGLLRPHRPRQQRRRLAGRGDGDRWNRRGHVCGDADRAAPPRHALRPRTRALGIPDRRHRSATQHRRRGSRAARRRCRQCPARRLRVHADPTARHRSHTRSRLRSALHLRHRDGWPRLAGCASADLVARPASRVDHRRVDPAGHRARAPAQVPIDRRAFRASPRSSVTAHDDRTAVTAAADHAREAGGAIDDGATWRRAMWWWRKAIPATSST